MKLSKLTKPELDEIFRNANFTEEEEQVFKMLSCGKTITETAQKINVCEHRQVPSYIIFNQQITTLSLFKC